LLAREVRSVDQLTGGRLELGLGTGHVRTEFEAAGLPWESPGRRVDRLAAMVHTVLDPELYSPPRPPLLLGGQGDRMLTLAARHADIAAFTGATLVPGSATGELHLVSADALAERVAYFDAAAGERVAEVEKNILVQLVMITDDRRGAVEQARARFGVDYLSVDELLEVPTLLVGTVQEITAQLIAARERFGFSYICALEPSMAAMGTVIARLRRVSTGR
jgi:probable F420-dependent oxidoreductase